MNWDRESYGIEVGRLALRDACPDSQSQRDWSYPYPWDATWRVGGLCGKAEGSSPANARISLTPGLEIPKTIVRRFLGAVMAAGLGLAGVGSGGLELGVDG
jgi:hypothetical protein